MDKDQRLLEEAYQSIYESVREPEYFGPKTSKKAYMKWLELHEFEVHEDGSVSVQGGIRLNSSRLTALPFNFRRVSGSFECIGNRLETLKGAPNEVGGNFYCGSNRLTSLEGAPEKVGKDFLCDHNQLKTLKGAPESVGGVFDCCDNLLTSLDGGPKTVSGLFVCKYNPLESLAGAPEELKGKFYSDKFSDEEYREYAKELARRIRIQDKYIKGKLDKEFDIDLKDF
jgi:hypothetical protein